MRKGKGRSLFSVRLPRCPSLFQEDRVILGGLRQDGDGEQMNRSDFWANFAHHA